MSEDAVRPIIIKRRVVKGGGHHGGAWKVAYADFVTAMMAFFLMMWLINATSDEQKGGIAEYFSPAVPMSREAASGDGILGGDSIMSEDNLTDDASDVEMTELRSKLNAEGADGLEADDLTRHMFVHMTEEGLVIEVVERAGGALFESGSAVPSPLLVKIIGAIAPVIGRARNRVGVSGHTDAYSFAGSGSYDNWELSSDRATVARRLLDEADLPRNRFISVEGRGASAPISDDPRAPENRRISITLFHASKYPLVPAGQANSAN
jgi:chemotaxis protein MotB